MGVQKYAVLHVIHTGLGSNHLRIFSKLGKKIQNHKKFNLIADCGFPHCTLRNRQLWLCLLGMEIWTTFPGLSSMGGLSHREINWISRFY